MCGIAGFIQRAVPSMNLIDRMTDRLSHRGPDGRGIWRSVCSTQSDDWSVALGHRRLAIIDPAGGHQPLANEDGSVWITYNGEIYNFKALRDGLLRRGHQFATLGDTEVIVHHYEEHGTNDLATLDGMFALAIWDHRAGQLLLARDRIGIKPLYYAPLPNGGIAFASELTALLEHPDIDRTLDVDGVASFFFQDYVHPPHTIIRGARKLPPGHFLTWAAGRISSPQPFWSVAIGSDRSETLADTLRSKLHFAVKSQLVADVPVGVFLSGGIDSSLVAALAQQHSTRRLKTFTIQFQDRGYDESHFAKQVAEHIGSEHIEETFSESSLLESFDSALACLDEPMADPSILPTYVLSRLAARHVKAVLGGDGGDELWAGYPTCRAHRLARIYRLLPGVVRRQLLERCAASLPVREGYQKFEWKIKRFVLRWDDHFARRHFRWMSNLDLAELAEAIPALACPPLDHLPATSSEFHGLNDILALDLQSYLPGSVLTKVDRASMAHGLEVRPPLLANDLVDFAFSVDGSLKVRGSKGKMLLKQAVTGLLPGEIVHRRKKGFAIPLSRWLRGPLKARLNEVFAQSPLWDSGMVNPSVFLRWRQQHEEMRVDRSRPLYALMVLDNWFRRLSDVGRSHSSQKVPHA